MRQHRLAGEHGTSPPYVRHRKNNEAKLARAEKQASRRKPKELPKPDGVATARGAHSRGYQGLVVRADGSEKVPPCGHQHPNTAEARDCVDPAKEYR